MDRGISPLRWPRPPGGIGWVLVAAVVLKIVFIWYLGDRVYGDVTRALTFGSLIDRKVLTIETAVINSKTFLGPILWFQVYKAAGVVGLQLLNLCLFVLIALTHIRLGKGRFSALCVTVALLLLGFYAGTNRNVVAGEQDDNMSMLLFSLGMLICVSRGSTFAGALLMGASFLFKFWSAIFFAGFAAHLLMRRRLAELFVATLGMVVPFVLINLADGFASLDALLLSLRLQHGFSEWPYVALKLVSTGMLFSVLISAWVWYKDRSDHNSLLFFTATAYFGYVLVNRDAWSASFAMEQSLVFSSFLVAEFFLGAARRAGGVRRRTAGVFLLSYVAVNSAITYQNLYRDTRPLTLVEDDAESVKHFGRRSVPTRRIAP